MSRKDNLLKRLGANMIESLSGKRPPGRPAAETSPSPAILPLIEPSTEAPANTTSGAPPQPEAPASASQSADRYRGRGKDRAAGTMRVDAIIPDPAQPRKRFDPEAISGMAATMRVRGVLQSVRIRWAEELGKWMLLTGERRWRAAQLAGLEEIPCIFVEGELTEDERLEEQLIENLQRTDLDPIDLANGLALFMAQRNLTGRDLAEQLGVAQSTVSRALSLRSLCPEVQEEVRAGVLTTRTAAEISRLETAEEQRAMAERVKSEGLSKEETAETVRRKKGEARTGEKKPKDKLPPLFGTAETLEFPIRGGRVSVTLARNMASDGDCLAITVRPAGLLAVPTNLRHGDVGPALVRLAGMLEGEEGRLAA